ncbi:Protein of unknown function [Pyronema omphalodes CBS 100304]|uniref:Uncharacterized protein n=1 Tax=Pyronema omphalodes (strain CBS 100304) TaxID=1076935 RepID=U4LE54_PYROM|nr:Protein of unknown function [Pyronema omphalodes CBS 100304]
MTTIFFDMDDISNIWAGGSYHDGRLDSTERWNVPLLLFHRRRKRIFRLRTHPGHSDGPI